MAIPNINAGLNQINQPFNLSSMLSFGQGNTSSPVNTPTPVGQTDPSKVAGSTSVKNPANTSAQSNVISSGAKSNDLVSQLYGQVKPTDYNTNISTNGLYAPKVANSPQPTGSGTPNTGAGSLGYGIGTTTPTTPVVTPPVTTPTNPANTGNAMLNDPELSAINANIENVAGQEANIQGNQNKFIIDEYGNAIASPTTGDFFNNQTGAGSFNAMKTAQEEGNLGLEMSALQSGFGNRESQLEKGYTQTPVSPGGVNVNPYTGQPVASAPEVVGFGQGVYTPPVVTPENPTGGAGAASTGSGISPSDPFYATLQSYAQMAANGQISQVPSSITGNAVLNAQMNEMAKSINPNYNPVVSAAQSASTASNVETQGTAKTNAANTGYTAANQEYNDNVAKYTALTGISGQVESTLSNYANTGALTDANAAINTLQGHLSNPDYQKFITAIGNAQASYQDILGSAGVTPSKADQDALAALNPNSSASTIIAALNQLSADAHALIVAPTYQKVQTYKQQLGI